MSWNMLRVAGLSVLMCSFVALPAQQQTSPPSLLPVPSPQEKSSPDSGHDILETIPPAPVFVPQRQRGFARSIERDSRPQASSIGAQWDRYVQALQAKDEEIRKVQEHLGQLLEQRSGLAAKLAETARKLAPMVQKAQEAEGKSATIPAPPPPAKVIPDTPRSDSQSLEDVRHLQKPDAAGKSLKGVERKPTTGNSLPPRGTEDKQPKRRRSELHAAKDNGKKVVVLCNCPDSFGAQGAVLKSMLPKAFIQTMQAECSKTGEEISFVDSELVENYLSSQKNWWERTPQDLAKHFETDWVIVLDLKYFSIYDPTSEFKLFQGNCHLEFSMFNMLQPKISCTGSCSKVFPKVPEFTNESESQFRKRFVNAIASQLSSNFAGRGEGGAE
jgi:hypothetical protein